MKITKQIRALIALFAALITLNMIFLLFARQYQSDMSDVYEMRNDFVIASHEFRMTSVSLSNFMRAYIAWGFESQLDLYTYNLHTIDIFGTIRQEFVSLGALEHEMYLFERAMYYQNVIRRLDVYSVELRRDEQYTEALAVLYGFEYNMAGISFVNWFNQFNEASLGRIDATLTEARLGLELHEGLSFTMTVILGVTVIMGTYFVLSRARAVAYQAQAAGELNQVILNNSPMMMNIWDENISLVKTSRQAMHIFGLDDESEYISRFGELSPEYQPCGTLSADKVKMLFEQTTKEGLVQTEWMHQKPCGEPIPMDLTLAKETYGGKSILIAYLLDLRPIKAAMRIEEELRKELELNEDMQRLFEVAPMAVNLYNSKFELIQCNLESVKMFGFGEDKKSYMEHFNLNMVEFSKPVQPCGSLAKDLLKDIRGRAVTENRIRFDWVYINRFGTEIPAEVSVVNILMGDSYTMVMYIHDLSAVVLANQKKLEASQLNQLYLNACPMFIERWSLDSELLDCNEKAVEVFGLGSKEELLENYYKFSPEFQPCGRTSAQLIADSIKIVMETGSCRYEYVHLTADGEELPVEVTNVLIKHSDGDTIVSYNHDLREIKAAEARIRAVNELNQTILDSAPFMIGIWDEKINMVDAGKQATEIFKVSADEIIAEKIYSFSPEYQPCGRRSADIAVGKLEQAFDEGSNQFDWMHMDSEGELIPAEVFAKRFSYDGKETVVTYTVDMRRIHEAMQKEREANALNQMIFDSSPLVITLWDENRNILKMSKFANEMFGVAEDVDVPSMMWNFSPIYQPDGVLSLEFINERFNEAFDTGRTRFEWMHQKADGTPMPTDIAYRAFEHDGQQMIVSYTVDVTSIKRAADKVRAADERATLMLDATPLACFMAKLSKGDDNNLTFKALDCNEAAIKLFGFENKKDACESFRDIFPEKTVDGKEIRTIVFPLASKALDEGSVIFELDQRHVEGNIIPCEITMLRVEYKDESVLACYFRDLREHKRMIEGLKRIDAAEEESRAKTRFLARMSHEIRTPMNAVMGISEAELQKDNHPQETEEALMRIHNSSSMLLGIINDILDLSKAEAGKMEIVPAVYEVASFVADALQLNLMNADSDNIKFNLDIDPDMPAKLIGDELRFKQILSNLLSNAFKYTKKGEVRLSIGMERPKHNADSDDIVIIVSVSDTGQGMSGEQLSSLFAEEYTRFNHEANRLIEGSGLGMMITGQLVAMMGGEIKVYSQINKGSTFAVYIPQKVVLNDTRPMGAHAAKSLQKFDLKEMSLKRIKRTKRKTMTEGRVLVVDDVESNIYVALRMLKPYKIGVETASSGFEAIGKIEAGETFDIIFMDHMMPKLDGIETTKVIRDMGYTKPIVALTANALKGMSKIFLESGFDDFISKPIDVEMLDKVLNQHIKMTVTAEEVAAARESDDTDIGDLTGAFLMDATRAIEVIAPMVADTNPMSEEDMKVFATQAHAMKAALAIIGQMELSAVSAELESAVRHGDVEGIKERAFGFLQKLEALAKELTLALAIANEPEESDLPADGALIESLLDSVADACENFDIQTARQLVDRLSQKEFSSQVSKFLTDISASLLYGDFDQAAELARKESGVWKAKK
ncbi:MAG: PAS domain-containing protein [Defluviitaleaceae bacterium]|nr:PAS domain-containing protein [Defluviitaleaceae bacterium]